jgi:hypothetical protein
MNRNENRVGEAVDPMLEEALRNFRQSLHAWSDAAYSRPRPAVRIPAAGAWRPALAWALGCVLVTAALSGGTYEHHERALAAKRAMDAAATRAQQVDVEKRAQLSDEDLLAAVDSDVSRTVPAAMEPLAQLMDGEDQGQ